ncbi:MAG: CRTAC1 family protein [Acidobacteriota bacterium]
MSRAPRARCAKPRLALLAACLAVGLAGCGPSPESRDSGARPAAGERPAGAAEDPRSPGTLRMVERLEALGQHRKPMDDPFASRERLALLRASPPPGDERESVRLAVRVGVELLNAGRSGEAAQLFAESLERVSADPARHPEGLEFRLRSQLALAHLRRGEQENCLDGHNIDSCLMPIREGGVHEKPDGSRAAFEVFEALLEERPEDLGNRWLYNVAAMTLGVYPDRVREEWLIEPEAFESEEPLPGDQGGRFVDLAPALGLDTVGLAGGSVLDDFNGDGRLDVVFSAWGTREQLRFFTSEIDGPSGTLRFEERTEAAGLEGLVGGLNLVHGDVDNDGDLDLLVLRGAWRREQGRWPNSLLLNDGSGGFEDVTEAWGLLSFRPTQVGVFADFDGDGWLDLFIGNEAAGRGESGSELYLNTGASGVPGFSEATSRLGDTCPIVKGAAAGDADEDGRIDLFLSCFGSANRLLRNVHDGDGVGVGPLFLDVTERAGVAEPLAAFAAWFFDYDNDGRLDLFASGYARSFEEARWTSVVSDVLGAETGDVLAPRLYRNLGDGRFEDRTREAGLLRPLLTMGANFGDVDQDGFLDLYLGTGAPDFRALVPNRMLRNRAGESFADVTTAAGVGHLQKGHGVSFGDLDNDGDEDIVTVLGGAFDGDVYANAVFVNPRRSGAFVSLRLEGTESNRDAIGARVHLRLRAPSGARSVHRQVGAGGSFGASSLRLEVGLGDAAAIESLEIRWPRGRVERFSEVPMGAHLRLLEGSGQLERRSLAALPLPAPRRGSPHDHGAGLN